MEDMSPAKKRKLDTQGDGDDDEGGIQNDTRRLACPFFKRKPTNTRPSCVYPGFKNIARLKEHLYRQHMLPPNLCARCQETFESEAQLRDHTRILVPCPLSPDKHGEGITLEQEKALKSKKRTTKSGINTDEEKWKDVYTILFPNETPPSAFSGSPRYEQSLKQELPDLVKAEIEEVEDLANHGRLIHDIVWNCLETIFSRWHQNTDEVHPVVTPTTIETSPSVEEEPADGADDAPTTPKAVDAPALGPASPQSAMFTVERSGVGTVGSTASQPGARATEDAGHS
ncbi:zinc finger c2h2-type protein [Diplodia corticola]|uniref:Zinc finger c2h2-type protein n=1 Tax=Diplodia corticola TaxID=236234 RepID=A0A1J9RFC8_9PEZI|nr:zinc finger c2h2-type protein [Diplodia corticola]OJD31267.1 zinc finger c2h2-type protein [Diplodia corticola]